MIPSFITKSHVLRAMRRISRDGVPPRRKSRVYCLIRNGRHFPPKYTIALAHEMITGRFLGSDEFEGGAEANSFLESLGFCIRECRCGGTRLTAPSSSPSGPIKRIRGDAQASRASGKTDSRAVPAPIALRAALVFPETGAASSDGIPPGSPEPAIPSLASFAGETVDFVLFPEEYVSSSDSVRIELLSELASNLDAPLLAGAVCRCPDSTGRTVEWQVLLRIDPDGSRSRIYTKHSTAEAVAFQKVGWKPDDMLPTFELRGVRAGATICHDHYLGLLPHFLASQGACIWVNPSFDNVDHTKWSSVLRLRAVENGFFALCTLHDNGKKRTHPFAFSPDGKELAGRKAGSTTARRLSQCKESGSVYMVDLDMSMVGKPLDWSQIPCPEKPQKDRSENPGKPVSVKLIDKRPAVLGRSGWRTPKEPGGRVETDQGPVYVGLMVKEQVLNPAECFHVIDRAERMNCAPVIWNVWDDLPADPARLATLMMGRAIECCAPVLVSDRTGIHELVELSNSYKIPARRTVKKSGRTTMDISRAWGLKSAFKMVNERLAPEMGERALDRYRGLASPFTER